MATAALLSPPDAAHRRAAAAASTTPSASASAPNATTGRGSNNDLSDPDKKRKRRPYHHAVKSAPRRALEALAALVVLVLGAGQLGYLSQRQQQHPQQQQQQHWESTSQEDAEASTAALAPPQPAWVRSLTAAADPFPGMSLTDSRYGNEMLLGRYRFHDSPGCRVPVAAARDDAPVCVAYYPEVELSDHLDREEALDLMPPRGMQNIQLRGGRNLNTKVLGQQQRQQQQQQQGGGAPAGVGKGRGGANGVNGAVMGHKVQLPDGVDDNVAILTRHGYKGALPGGQINQDRSIIISPYFLNEEMISTSNRELYQQHRNDFVMGLFDGHGERGHAVSELVVREFPRTLAKHLEGVSLDAEGRLEEDAAVRAIMEAYQEIDDRAAELSGAGCTATSILRVGNELYVINTGDSRSFVGTYIKSKDGGEARGRTSIAFLSAEHKPDLPEERSRIERMGGQVMLPPKLPPGSDVKLSARVLAMLPNGMQLGLAMSRSIGDPEAAEVGVIATPTVTVLRIDELRAKAAAEAGEGVVAEDVHVFAVVASDGIYDHVEPEEVASHLAESLYDRGDAGAVAAAGGRPSIPSPLRACEELIMRSSERWLTMGMDMAYRDDISIAVSKVLPV